MRGVRISSLELDSDGSVAVEKLADIFADGEVAGESYLASSLRKSVEERGPMALDRVIRLYNNGYFGAAWMYKGRVYIKDDSEAPEGARVQEGPRGGKYYETKAGRGRPIGEAPKDWSPQVGDRIRFRWPGDRFNGRLGRITDISETRGRDAPDFGGTKRRRLAQVNGIGWHGGALVDLSEGKLVPAPYTAKEKKTMRAKDIMVEEFGRTSRSHGKPVHDDYTELDYDAFSTEAGPLLLVKSEPGKDKPWAATKESAVSLRAFMQALPEMQSEALQHMKDEVAVIIFSPVSNPNDRKQSQVLGSKFTSAATMDMSMRIMHVYPKSKGVKSEVLAQVLTHETGHAIYNVRSNLAIMYSTKRREFWDKWEADTGKPMPVDDESLVAIEKEHGVPQDPNKWMDDWGRWKDFELGTEHPDTARWWRVLRKEAAWNDLYGHEQQSLKNSIRHVSPVSSYAHRNEKEYYAEAYTWYQMGGLAGNHIMYDHFENLERVKQWVQS